MHRVLHKSTAVFLATVVLMTTLSFTLDIHYCGDSLIDFSFTDRVQSCGMEKDQSTSGCEKIVLSKNSCCTDKQLIQEGEKDFNISANQFTLEQQVFVASFTYSYISLFEGTQSKEVPFVDYSPPFVKEDVQVLQQIFLI